MYSIRLRKWELEDLESLLKYADNQKIANNMTDEFPHPYTAESGMAFLEKVISMNPSKVLAIDNSGEAIGAIGIFPQEGIQRKNAELGYWLGEPHWNNGVITRAIPMMIEYAFSSFDINRIFARPFGRNIPSQKALEKSGFVLEARFPKTLIKNDVFEDELVYAVYKKA